MSAEEERLNGCESPPPPSELMGLIRNSFRAAIFRRKVDTYPDMADALAIKTTNSPQSSSGPPSPTDRSKNDGADVKVTAVDASRLEKLRWHNHVWFGLQIWWALVFHFVLCFAIALTMIYALDDYMALTASTPRPPRKHFRFRAEDITTIISAGLVLVRVAVESWAAVTVWRCAFALLEMRAIDTIPALNDLMSWPRLPRRRPKKLVGWAVGITLLFIFPQTYLSPLLSGAVGWDVAYSHDGNETVGYLARPPTSLYTFQKNAIELLTKTTGRMYVPYGQPPNTPRELLDWSVYSDPRNAQYFRPTVANLAIRQAGKLWKAGEHVPISAQHSDAARARQRTCRHLMQRADDAIMPRESILYNATLPCIQIARIEWGATDVASEFPSPAFYQANTSVAISANGLDPMFTGAFPGNAILFEKGQRWPSNWRQNVSIALPTTQVLTQTRHLLIKVGATVVNDTGNGLRCARPQTESVPAFGNITRLGPVTQPTGQQFPYCLAHARVTFTAGSLFFPTSKFLTDNVVEGVFPPGPLALEWLEDRWAADTLNLLPAVMDRVSEMNQSSIPTWDDIDGYVERLVRISYLSAWGALRQTMENPPPPRPATIAHERLRARVNHTRVLAWLGASLLLQLSGFVWYFGAQRRCRGEVVVDGHIAALLRNPEDLHLKVEEPRPGMGGPRRSSRALLKPGVIAVGAGAGAGAGVGIVGGVAGAVNV
ncbi:hypothetical protein DFH27DRAFT_552937 [Peziza echinospora]|nr:hypothetical protein DFH27DRAFT_552937 [Peziza echinospora]